VTVVLAAVAVVILFMPRWLSPLIGRLNPREAVRICVTAVALGALLLELSFVLFAVPAVLSTLGVPSLLASCQFLGNLHLGGLELGWIAVALAILFPLLSRRGWVTARDVAEEMRAEPALGAHTSFAGLDLVRLPTPALVAYSIGDPHPQIVVSEGLIELLEPEELDVVVGHEAAHVRDGHSRILQFLAALERPMPSLRWTTSSVRLAVERSADEAAIGRDPVRRGVLLDALLKVGAADAPVAVAAFTHRSGVVERAHALLAEPPDPTRIQRIVGRATLGGAAVCGVAVVAGWAFEAHMLLAMSGICCK
jgi:hypothetical protein